MNWSEILLNRRLVIQRNHFNGLEQSLFLSFIEEFLRRRQTLFGLEISGSFVKFKVFEGLERLDTEKFLFGHD